MSCMGEYAPGCNRGKRQGRTVCICCWNLLPRDVQIRLYNRIGEGYEEAYAEAMRVLLPPSVWEARSA